MAARVELVVYENNDETIDLAVTTVDGDPYDLTDANLELLIKPAADTPDDGPGVVVLSTGTGEITITDAEGGAATAEVSRSHLAVPGTRVWRVDVVRPGSRRTAMYGPFHVVNL